MTISRRAKIVCVAALSQDIGERLLKTRATLEGGRIMAGFVQGVFLAPEGGAQMKSVQAATALEVAVWRVTAIVPGRGTGAASAGSAK